MLASIVPLVERARNRSWGVTTAAYVVGSVVAGAVLGASLGAVGSFVLGPVTPGPRSLLVVAAAALPGGRGTRPWHRRALGADGAPPGQRGVAPALPGMGVWPRLRRATGPRRRDDRHDGERLSGLRHRLPVGGVARGRGTGGRVRPRPGPPAADHGPRGRTRQAEGEAPPDAGLGARSSACRRSACSAPSPPSGSLGAVRP